MGVNLLVVGIEILELYSINSTQQDSFLSCCELPGNMPATVFMMYENAEAGMICIPAAVSPEMLSVGIGESPLLSESRVF